LAAARCIARPSASVTEDLTHSLDVLTACGDINVAAAFGPQHGLRGDKQDNMIESPDFDEPGARHPGVQSVWRGAPADDAMMDTCDVTSSICMTWAAVSIRRHDAALCLEAASKHGKAVWVLDRPNPLAGRSKG